MPRRPAPAPVWALLCLISLVLSGALAVAVAAAPAGAQVAPPYPAKAWILVDGDTGKVLDAFNEHQPMPPASTQKIMTALVATEKLSSDASFTVGTVAAAQAAMRIGMVAGEQWTLGPALHSLMMVSANDAAYALAEAASGSLEAFAADMNDAAARYGMVDSRFLDPAGFDGAEGFNGGSRVSAYDLAIAARNYLSIPELAAIVGMREYRFDGPDGKPHVLYNHNKLLARYPGATGLKTGYTSMAGNTFVGTAVRDGRTMIAVVLNSTNMYGVSAALLDKGFATPPDAPGLGVILPPVRAQTFRPVAMVPNQAVAEQHPVGTGGGSRTLTVLFFVMGSTAGVVVALRRRAERRRRARAARRRRMAEMRRAAYLAALDDDAWDIEMAIPVQGQFEPLAPLPTPE
ncbi:MAG TPA: D-alanyl-D-alanine carboxypeptidase [Acidimicrobiia bacterium]|nr:D-alanyl-D-alanine carboxypeptidase [Acidimicrobiia bacterium]